MGTRLHKPVVKSGKDAGSVPGRGAKGSRIGYEGSVSALSDPSRTDPLPQPRSRWGTVWRWPGRSRPARATSRVGPGSPRLRGWGLVGWPVLAVVIAPFLLTLVYTAVPPVSMPMLGRALALKGYERQWVPLERIAPSLPVAVLSSEDARFCRHWGVDFDAIALVMRQGGDAGPSRGASTIAMQVVKNLYLWYLPTPLRKPLEVPLALWTDLVWSKRRVIEVYLNTAQWGDGVYGVEAAAHADFGRSAADLSPRQAALLAVALPNPIRRDPGEPSRRLRSLAGLIGARAKGAGGSLDCIR